MATLSDCILSILFICNRRWEIIVYINIFESAACKHLLLYRVINENNITLLETKSIPEPSHN